MHIQQFEPQRLAQFARSWVRESLECGGQKTISGCKKKNKQEGGRVKTTDGSNSTNHSGGRHNLSQWLSQQRRTMRVYERWRHGGGGRRVEDVGCR